MRKTNRLPPQLPAQNMKTYQVTSPVQTHFRRANCEEVECANNSNGFKVVVDENTDLGKKQAHHIRNTCVQELVMLGRPSTGVRRYSETRDAELTTFTFPAGQQCFQVHQVPLERPEIYVVKEGDWRGNPRGTSAKKHKSAENWLDDFATHQDQLNKRLQEG